MAKKRSPRLARARWRSAVWVPGTEESERGTEEGRRLEAELGCSLSDDQRALIRAAANGYWQAVWEPGTEEWRRLEAELGCNLSHDQRELIKAAVSGYWSQEGKERAAPFIRHEADWLMRLRKLSTELRGAIDEAVI